MLRPGLTFIIVGFILVASTRVGADSDTHPAPGTDATVQQSSFLELETLRRSGYEGPVDISSLRQREPNRKLGPRGDVQAPTTLTVAGDENWWDGFEGTALEYEVNCAVLFQGSLIVGGSFDNAGGIPGTEGIARWDGFQWCSLSAGLSNNVYALAVFQNELYVGGAFLQSTPGISYLVRWDGFLWRSVLTEPNDFIYALHIFGGNLYVGGDFTNLGGVNASRIAIWNGTSWSAMGSGTNNTVHAITDYRGEIVVGGDFTQSGVTPLNQIARWSGSSWQPLGVGTNSYVNTLAVSDTFLYAGGTFTQAGGITANRVARWDGVQWNALGTGLNSEVLALAFVGSDLWAGGYFMTAGGINARGLARWDGVSWNSFGTGLGPEIGNGWVGSISVLGDTVYVGGFFQNANGTEAINFAAWSNGVWNTPMASTGNGTLRQVYTIAQYHGDIFAGGTFVRAGSQKLQCIARWDGSTWYPMGNPAQGVGCFTIYNDRLIAGGDFTSLGGVSVSKIAQWDGVSWQPIGTGMNSSVLALAVIGGDLYAAGLFTTAGGVPANRVARWDGTNWSALGTGISGGSGPILWGLGEYAGSIYVGGKFTTAGSVTTTGLARWDGTAWYAVGGGVQGIDNGGQSYDPTVYDFANYGGRLIVGGDFTRANGLVTKYIATWDGSSWGTLGVGAGGRLFALAVYGTDLVAAGYARPGGGSGPPHYIAKWDGSTWLAMGSGMNGYVNGLSVLGGSLYVGGAFQSAGGKSSLGIARWTDVAVSSVPQPPRPTLVLPFPNPFQAAVTVQYEAAVRGPYRLDVFDLQGRRVRALDRGEFGAGTRQATWDGRDDQARNTPPGVYFLRIEGPTGIESFKIVRQR